EPGSTIPDRHNDGEVRIRYRFPVTTRRCTDDAAAAIDPRAPVLAESRDPLAPLRSAIIEKENDVPAASLEADAAKITLLCTRVGGDPCNGRELLRQGSELGTRSGMHDDHFRMGLCPD